MTIDFEVGMRKTFAFFLIVGVVWAVPAISKEHRAIRSKAANYEVRPEDRAVCEASASSGKVISADEIERAVAKLISVHVRKDEFETSDAYKKRAAAAVAPVEDSLGASRDIPYIVAAGRPPKISYDADNKLLIVSFENGYVNETTYGLEDQRIISVVKEYSDDKGTYEAVTAFGVNVKVKKEENKYVGIAIA